MENSQCSLCTYRNADAAALIKHVVRFHRRDPQFQVTCRFGGCNATYKVWASFKQHVYRKHPGERVVLDQAVLDQNIPNEEPMEIGGEADSAIGGEQHSADEDAGAVNESPKDFLRWQTGMFLLSIREECKMSQTAMKKLIQGLDSLLTAYNEIIMEHVKSQADPTLHQVSMEALDEAANMFPATELLSQFKTKYLLEELLKKECNFVAPKLVYARTDHVWKKSSNGTVDAVEKQRYAYVVPFLPMLKVLLENDQISHCVNNPRLKIEGTYQTILDGSLYQSSGIFSPDEKSLAIVGYYDDLHITSGLSPTTAVSKLVMFYWVLANIYPELRSKLQAINLLTIVNHNVLQKFGAEKVLEFFRDDILLLQTEGITITTNGVQKVYKGSVLFIAGDTPASAYLGVFKQSVSAIRFSRTCNAKQDDWKSAFHHDDFTVRTKESHADQVQIISDETHSIQMRNFWKKRYGVNCDSCLSQILGFDVTKCFPAGLYACSCRRGARGGNKNVFEVLSTI